MPSTNVEARQAAMPKEIRFSQSEIISQDRTNEFQLELLEQTRLWRRSLRERGAASKGEAASTASAASPSTMETMMLCPQGITPVLYQSGKGQATASLVSLGNVKGKEGFTDTIMEEALGDEGNDFQAMLEDVKQIKRQSPSPLGTFTRIRKTTLRKTQQRSSSHRMRHSTLDFLMKGRNPKQRRKPM